jgi:hypothetical protein
VNRVVCVCESERNEERKKRREMIVRIYITRFFLSSIGSIRWDSPFSHVEIWRSWVGGWVESLFSFFLYSYGRFFVGNDLGSVERGRRKRERWGYIRLID